MATATLFDRLGIQGATGMALALYDRAIASERLEPYFRGVDMQRLVEHQALFLAYIMGGPASYSDEELRRTHAPLHIDQPAFEEMLGMLREVLAEWDLGPADIEQVMAAMTSRRPSIIGGRKRSGPRVA